MYMVLYRFYIGTGGRPRGFGDIHSSQALDGDFNALARKYDGYAMLGRIRPHRNLMLARGTDALDLVDELNRLVRVVEEHESDLVQRFRNLALNCFGEDMEIHYEIS
ncbi:hypothetical protein [Glycomyces niveus]|uniref:Uncharacterized protein n=1 Tax=Glycomyces niveus TaxID=2820287 RepID=A0ABS3UAA5_9ACTN|nr:hypothetical protein [Glycomyces sp. NEAU-S30]MBO3735702.1 hypothetical protein [Glycomyces sp. NEAU-S30]